MASRPLPVRLLCLLLPGLPLACAATPLLRSEGVASDSNGAVLYREVHWQRGLADGSPHWVIYQCPDGAPFARKSMPASSAAQARGYSLQDQRSGQRATVQVQGDQVRVDWQEQAAARARTAQLALPPQAVIDAGFDAAVRLHWQGLVQGTPVSLPFLVPGRQQFYPVKVQHIGATVWNGVAAQQIQVSLGTWYGAIAPSLALVYADNDRRLLEFRGTSNLRDGQGRYPQVVVRFPAAPSAGDPTAWQQDLQRPLVARCVSLRG